MRRDATALKKFAGSCWNVRGCLSSDLQLCRGKLLLCRHLYFQLQSFLSLASTIARLDFPIHVREGLS